MLRGEHDSRQPERWHHQRIKAEIRIRRGNLKNLGEELGVTGAAVGQACRGKQMRRIQVAISELIGVPLSELWPDLYTTKKSAKRRAA